MAGRGKSQKNIDLIDAAYRILAEIQPATVRAVCYRLFVEGLIPDMSKASANRVSVQLRDAREDGIIPWEWTVDETRHAEEAPTWANPTSILRACANQYRRDHWQDQPNWLEVWSEKGTVRGTLAPILDKYGVTFRVMHGHGSATAVHDVAEMCKRSTKRLTMLYVGDWDPSGMHMSEIDLPTRLTEYGADNVDVVRVAIARCDTMPKARVPSFPASDKGPTRTSNGDPRYNWYVKNYGHRCWELDALSPVILRRRVESEIVQRLDLEAWNHSIRIEAAEIESMRKFLKTYPGNSGLAPECEEVS